MLANAYWCSGLDKVHVAGLISADISRSVCSGSGLLGLQKIPTLHSNNCPPQVAWWLAVLLRIRDLSIAYMCLKNGNTDYYHLVYQSTSFLVFLQWERCRICHLVHTDMSICYFMACDLCLYLLRLGSLNLMRLVYGSLTRNLANILLLIC